MFSYLAQIEGGLRLLRHEVEGALDVASEESGGDKDSGNWQAEGGISPTAAAIAAVLGGAAGLPVGLLAGMAGKVQYQHAWETATNVIRTTTNDTTSRADLTILHHAAFDLVMANLTGKVKVAKGGITLLPVASLGKAIGTLQEKGVGAVTTPESLIGVAALAALSDFGMQTIFFLEGADNLHAFVQDQHFTIPPTLFSTTYGSCTSIPFSVAYIEAQDTRQPRNHVPKQFGNAGAKKQFNDLTDMFRTLPGLLGMGDGIRVFPLAIYRDL